MTKQFDYSLEGLIEQLHATGPMEITVIREEGHYETITRPITSDESDAERFHPCGRSTVSEEIWVKDRDLETKMVLSPEEIKEKSRNELLSVLRLNKIRADLHLQKHAGNYIEKDYEKAAKALGYRDVAHFERNLEWKKKGAKALKIAKRTAVAAAIFAALWGCKEYAHYNNHKYMRDNPYHYPGRSTYDAPRTFIEKMLNHHYGEKPKEKK